jgi:A/G-specific adenine glycosylase
VHIFTKTLLKWHHENPRPLPWSGEQRDPYSIWISEIIMQQTRIEQGKSYYLNFINRFPNVTSLAAAQHDEVMHMWQGLGYYTRARNLHKAAKHIVENLEGKFPHTYDSLLDLPGIGPYSAAAISSFAYGHRHVVVDGNVKRLISRYAGIADSIDDPSTHEKIRSVASDFMSGAAPEVFNQAIMNFGALVCKPKPDCSKCPLALKCYAFKHNLTSSLPVRTKKKLNRDRYFHFIVMHYKGKFLLQRREGKDIWKGLYSPPLMESSSLQKPHPKKIESFVQNITGHQKVKLHHSAGPYKQALSHQTIHGKFHHAELLKAPVTLNDQFIWVNEVNIHSVGKPKMVVDVLDTLARRNP